MINFNNARTLSTFTDISLVTVICTTAVPRPILDTFAAPQAGRLQEVVSTDRGGPHAVGPPTRRRDGVLYLHQPHWRQPAATAAAAPDGHGLSAFCCVWLETGLQLQGRGDERFPPAGLEPMSVYFSWDGSTKLPAAVFGLEQLWCVYVALNFQLHSCSYLTFAIRIISL